MDNYVIRPRSPWTSLAAAVGPRRPPLLTLSMACSAVGPALPWYQSVWWVLSLMRLAQWLSRYDGYGLVVLVVRLWRRAAIILGWIECDAVFIAWITSRNRSYPHESYLTWIWPCPLSVANCLIDLLLYFYIYRDLLDPALWTFENIVVNDISIKCGCCFLKVVSRSSAKMAAERHRRDKCLIFIFNNSSVDH